MQSEIKKGVEKCADECLYFDLCGGGTPSNKFYENGSFATSETMECKLHKQVLLDTVFQKLSEISPK
jgi:uncharacterized protein